jgi:hypothetical protein
MQKRTEGSRYTGFRPVTEIAKDIRRDIKAAVKDGSLPADLKVSVRSNFYAGGQSIDLDWSAVHGTHQLQCSYHRAPWNLCEGTCDPEFYLQVGLSTHGQVIERKLNAIANAYNYDNSDVQSDYFDTLYYCTPQWDWRIKPKGTNIVGIDPTIAETFATFVYTDYMRVNWAVKIATELCREEK